jgi:cytochrome P450
MNNSAHNVPPVGAKPVGIFGDDFVVDPFSLFATLRSRGPVISVPLSFGSSVASIWIVTRFQEAVQVLKNQLFTVDPSRLSSGDENQAFLHDPGRAFEQSMLTVDEPDHRRLRSLVSKAFTPKYIQSLRPGIQKIADDLLDHVQDRGYMDLVNEYAFPLPINVISTMLGVSLEKQPLIREWSKLFSGGASGTEPPQRQAVAQAFTEYLAQLLAEKRAHPQHDLVSQLIEIEEAGDRLNEKEVLSMIKLLIFAGHETTSNLISTGMLALFDQPGYFEHLKANLDLVPSTVEEFLRYHSPILATRRYATEDVVLSGQSLHKGDMLLIVLGSANRDERQFTNPDELEAARSFNHHIAFGQGIHTCLGAPLARLEGDIAFTTLLRRLPTIQLALPKDALAWRGNLFFHGVQSLPVTFSVPS